MAQDGIAPPHDTELFPRFYTNPAIKAITPASRWTITAPIGAQNSPAPIGAQNSKKAPVDIRHVLAGCNDSCLHEGPVRGAYRTDSTCLMSLPELSATLSNTPNLAFYLQSATDGLMVTDIEPSCPPEISQRLLAMNDILYAEISMSGNGYHLLTRVPSNLGNYPMAASRRVVKEPHGWYELLFEHWITFTRQTIAPEAMPSPIAGATPERLYAHLARNITRPSRAATRHSEQLPGIDIIPHAEAIVETTISTSRNALKEPGNFDGDLSRWEFSTASVLYRHLERAITRELQHQRAAGKTPHSYSPDERTALLSHLMARVLPARPKHESQRNGQPYLDYIASVLVQDREAERESAKRAK